MRHRTNVGLKLDVMGRKGEWEPAKRPPDNVIETMNDADLMERLSIAISLAKAGFTILSSVDVDGWDYWKTMERARADGFTWVPAAHMPNLPIAPRLWAPSETNAFGIIYDPENPPVGAIRIPPSLKADPNYVPAPPLPQPEPAVVDFGAKFTDGYFIGSYLVGAGDTADLWSIQTGPDGGHYMKTNQFMFGWVYVKVS